MSQATGPLSCKLALHTLPVTRTEIFGLHIWCNLCSYLRRTAHTYTLVTQNIYTYFYISSSNPLWRQYLHLVTIMNMLKHNSLRRNRAGTLLLHLPHVQQCQSFAPCVCASATMLTSCKCKCNNTDLPHVQQCWPCAHVQHYRPVARATMPTMCACATILTCRMCKCDNGYFARVQLQQCRPCAHV